MNTTHRTHPLSILLLASCHIAHLQAQIPSRISGTITAEDGGLPLGTAVIIHKIPDFQNTSRAKVPSYRAILSSVRAPQTIPVSSAGAFEATGLPNGQYKLCVTAPDGYLDTCPWFGPVDVILAPGSASTGRNIILRKGAVVRIRLDDPQSLLPATETPAGERRAKIGVVTADGALRVASTRSRDTTGQDLVITVPFDKPLRLWVSPSQVAVRGPDGATITNAGPSTSFQVSRLAGPVNFRLQVVPRGAP